MYNGHPARLCHLLIACAFAVFSLGASATPSMAGDQPFEVVDPADPFVILFPGTTSSGPATGTPDVEIVYTLTPNGMGTGGTYQWTVFNNSLAVVEEFSIFFDVAVFATLSNPQAPMGWDPLVLPPDPLLPEDGLFDALADPGPGIAQGQSLGGFSVDFTFVNAVPSPVTPALLVLAVVGIALRRLTVR